MKTVSGHPSYECAFTLIAIVDLVAIFARDYIDAYGSPQSLAVMHRWEISQFVINLIFFAEFIFFVSVWGPRYCWRNKSFLISEIVL